MSEHAQLMDMQANILAAIEKNTDAVIKLAEALAGIRAKTEAAKVETTKAIEKAKTPPCAAHDAETAKVEAPAATGTVTFDEAKKALMAIPTDRARAILKSLGVSKLSELDADRYADVVEACRG